MSTGRSRQQLKYRDNKFQGTDEEYDHLISVSTTLYVGNMSFCTTEDQVFQLFNMAGNVKRIIMGIDRIKKTSCGFCFVEYYSREDAENAYNYINRTNLDERIIRTDWDVGFSRGRQYGRGRHGGQMRDEYRSDFDPGRGGFSVNMGQHIGIMER